MHSPNGKSKTQHQTKKEKINKIQVMMTRLTRPQRKCADYYTNKQNPKFIKKQGTMVKCLGGV
jgi:hypothetical protein